MPGIDIGHLVEGRRELTVEIGGNAFELAYDPNMFDETLAARAQRHMNFKDDDPERYRVVNTFLERMLVSWNVTDGENGPMVPINAESLGRIQFRTRVKLVEAVRADLEKDAGGPKSPGDSAASSPAQGRPEASPTPTAENGMVHPDGSSFSGQLVTSALGPGS